MSVASFALACYANHPIKAADLMHFASTPVREYGAPKLWSRSADWGGVRATVLRRERIQDAVQRFDLPWHAFRMGISGTYAAASTTRLSGGPAVPLVTVGGRASFYPAGTRIRNEIPKASRLTYFVLEIDRHSRSDDDTSPAELVPVLDLTEPLCLALLHRLREETEQPGAAPRLFSESAALLLLLAVSRRVPGGSPLQGGLSSAQLARVKDFMVDHLAEEIGLADIAAHAGVSRAHLCRAFKVSTGTTLARWLIRRRVERAQHLIERGEMPLAAIAVVTGFADQSHFTTAFRRHMGVTPGRWRGLRR